MFRRKEESVLRRNENMEAMYRVYLDNSGTPVIKRKCDVLSETRESIDIGKGLMYDEFDSYNDGELEYVILPSSLKEIPNFSADSFLVIKHGVKQSDGNIDLYDIGNTDYISRALLGKEIKYDTDTFIIKPMSIYLGDKYTIAIKRDVVTEIISWGKQVGDKFIIEANEDRLIKEDLSFDVIDGYVNADNIADEVICIMLYNS